MQTFELFLVHAEFFHDRVHLLAFRSIWKFFFRWISPTEDVTTLNDPVDRSTIDGPSYGDTSHDLFEKAFSFKETHASIVFDRDRFLSGA